MIYYGVILQHIVAKSSAISFTRRAARYTSQRGKGLEIGDFLPSESACEERPWKSPSPRADFLKLAGVRVARGSGAFVLKDLLPRYGSSAASMMQKSASNQSSFVSVTISRKADKLVRHRGWLPLIESQRQCRGAARAHFLDGR